MASLVRSALLRQCIRQLLAQNQRNLSVLTASKFSSVDLEPATAPISQKRALLANEFNQINQQFKRHKMIETRKILFTKDEITEKVMAVAKKHDKIDPAKVNCPVSLGLNSVLGCEL